MQSKTPTTISLQLYGFNHNWSSSKGWFFAPPGTYDGAFLTNDVTDINGEKIPAVCPWWSEEPPPRKRPIMIEAVKLQGDLGGVFRLHGPVAPCCR